MIMKKQLLLLVLMLLPLVASADVVEIDGIFYNIGTSANGRNRYAYVTSNPNKYSGDIVIPSTVIYEGQDYKVSSISEAAFKDCMGLTTIELPEGIGSIGSEAFYGCSNLSSFVIPNSVTFIWAGAFEGCSSLSSLVIPDKVDAIRSRTFKNCSSLTSITIGASVSGISRIVDYRYEDGAFYGCTNLSSINVVADNSALDSRDNCNAIIRKSDSTLVLGCKNTVIPNNVKCIGEGAFGGITEFSINIPNGVEVLENGAFYKCAGLTSVNISSTVKEIGVAFYGCTSLSLINVASDNPVYDSRDNCNAIIRKSDNTLVLGCKNTVIPNNVKWIGAGAFSGCTGLTSINIPNGVEVIDNGAFSDCAGLTSVDISSTVKIIGNAFYGCTNLSLINIAPDNPVYDSRDNCNAIIETKSNTLYIGCNNTVIPNSIKTIRSYAFYSSGLSSITIPSSVETINADAFRDCTELSSISLTNSSVSIAYQAFEGCSNLKSLEFHCNEIKAWFNRDNKIKFPYNQIETIIVGSEVKTIEENAFLGLNNLTSVHISDIPAWCRMSFGNASSNPLTYAGHLYLNDNEIEDLVIPDSITTISPEAFWSCRYLRSVTLNCPKVGSWFSGSTISNVVMGDKVESIDDYAFASCTGIKHITIGKGLSNVSVRAFANIENLEDVTCYAENVPTTDKTAFEKSYPDYAMLYVPEGSIEAYKATAPWSSFKNISAAKDYAPDDAEKCATPTISYSNGNITFDCETEDVVFVSDIKDDDIKNYTSTSIQLSATYKITVYATKTGMKKSGVASATLCWIDVEPKTEGINNGIAQVPAKAVLIQAADGAINVQGCDDGERIGVYSINGCQVGTSVSQNGTATINTTLQPGSVSIVKIGQKSVKVMMK